jgi:hypothetical protein
MKFSSRRERRLLVIAMLIAQITAACVPIKANAIDVGNVFGGGFDTNSQGTIDKVENRYHIDKDAAAKLIENMNVGEDKKTAPELSVFFTPTDPREGQEVVAEAVPIYFSTALKDLYFTWYLRRADCGLKDTRLTDYEKDTCDLDRNGKIEANDWKITAVRMNVAGGFVADDAFYGSVPGEDDKDGYRAVFGGEKRSGKAHCYMHNFASGKDYELVQNAGLPGQASACEHLFAQYPIDGSIVYHGRKLDLKDQAVGDGNFGFDEETFWNVDPKDPSTAQNGQKDEANASGLGRHQFKWNYVSGDKIGVVVEGESVIPTRYSDSSMQIMWAFSKNQCAMVPKTAMSADTLTSPDAVDYSVVSTGSPGSDGIPDVNQDANTGNDVIVPLRDANDDGLPDLVSSSYTDESGNVTVRTDYSAGKANLESATTTSGHAPKMTYGSDIVLRTWGDGSSTSVPTVETDLNECLSWNLLSPTEGNQAENLEVSLRTSPEYPVVDSFSEDNPDRRGSMLAARAVLSNSTTASSRLRYDWRVYANRGKKMSDDGWEDITDGLRSAGLLSRSSGNDLECERIDERRRIGLFRLQYKRRSCREGFSGGEVLSAVFFAGRYGLFSYQCDHLRTFRCGQETRRAESVDGKSRASRTSTANASRVGDTRGEIPFRRR